MIKKQTIETQLECRATASLHDSIAQDLSKPDKSLSELLDTEDKDESTTENQHNSSD